MMIVKKADLWNHYFIVTRALFAYQAKPSKNSGLLWRYTTNHKRVSMKFCMVGYCVESPLSPLMTSSTIRWYGCGPGAGAGGKLHYRYESMSQCNMCRLWTHAHWTATPHARSTALRGYCWWLPVEGRQHPFRRKTAHNNQQVSVWRSRDERQPN